ncbi:hypothetical protein Ahy_B04g073699 [Arachis hypogaea]|uniref:F-box associated domain-containing protein n=1 Tax=Arachis hypogaea TaxID=3818 RepID=A0A444ZRD6_ARAHY|nr:hypothetical protein Ahy_B04g073699 [Arachis hypogaea]
MPQQLVGDYPINLTILGGCLALYSYDIDNHKTEIWVMKEYKVPSSWILIYEIPYGMPLCISNGSDIIALNFTPLYSNVRFAKYNVSGELLNYSPPPRSQYDYFPESFCVYTESLLPFSSDIKNRDKKKKTAVTFTRRSSLQAKNVLNNMMLPKFRMTVGSNKGREYGASILVNNEHTGQQLRVWKYDFLLQISHC